MPEEIKLIDMETALKRVAGNKMLYGKLLQKFLESKEPQALQDALQNGDWAQGAELAHTLKGVAGNLALDALFESSTELMVQLREGAPGDEAVQTYRQALEDTRSAVEALLPQLQ